MRKRGFLEESLRGGKSELRRRVHVFELLPLPKR